MDNKKKKQQEEILVEFDFYKTHAPSTDRRLPVDTEVENPLEIKALIPGVINKINVSEGEEVTAGQVLMILEAMKMRNRIYTKVDGIVEKILVKEGERVIKNQMLVQIK